MSTIPPGIWCFSVGAEGPEDVPFTFCINTRSGDLNYRVIQEFSRVCSAIAAGALDALVSSDQLQDEIAQKAIFLGYHEGMGRTWMKRIQPMSFVRRGRGVGFRAYVSHGTEFLRIFQQARAVTFLD